MKLDLDRITNRTEKNEFLKNFIEELNKTLENMKNKINLKGENMGEIKLNPKEELEFDRKEFKFLQEYFKKELSDLSKGEIFIVTNKYENDNELHRYKVTQYKNNLECKYIAFEKDLPKNVKLGDVVRKINGIYIYDEQATKYINDSINKIKQDIINNRN